MSVYINTIDLRQRVGYEKLPLLINDPDNEAAIAGDVIDRAESRVDGYLSGRYATPVPVSGLLQEAALSIAEYELYRRADGPVPEKIRKSYEDAMKDLRAIAEGKMDIGGSATPEDATVDGWKIGSATDAAFDGESMEAVGW